MDRIFLKFAAAFCSLILMAGCSHKITTPNTDMSSSDPYLWLEDVRGEKALHWVEAHNKTTVDLLKADPRYEQLATEFRKIATAKDRIPRITIDNGTVRNFWQDDVHVQGVWRQTSVASYKSKDTKWETLLDFDELSKTEGVNLVYKGSVCLPPKLERCLVQISRGGKDALEVKEFDAKTKQFVKDGFTVPEAKTRVAWKDQDTIWLGTDFGPGSLTTSGYPLIVKLWKRGTPMAQAVTVYTGKAEDVGANGFTDFSLDGNVDLISRRIDFFHNEYFIVSKDSQLVPLPVPQGISHYDVFNRHFFFIPREDSVMKEVKLKAGNIYSIPLEKLDSEPVLIMEQPKNGGIPYMAPMKDYLLVQTIENVKSKLYTLSKKGMKKPLSKISGTVDVTSTSNFENLIVYQMEDFLVTPVQYSLDLQKGQSVKLRQLPERFNARGFQAEQWFSTSKDGTKVPFFIIHKKGLRFDGSNPVLLYGYGGFEINEEPFYLKAIGKNWLERGGVYVSANIRGGGEFGPQWHTSAIKENRQKVFDDFISIAEELIQRKVTTPKKMGIMGGSNGGLLVGTVMTQRPDLFNAVVCQVPLLDMLRFNKLLAGASWMGEYGNPDEPAMREVLKKYSPYHNLDPAKEYPKAFIATSTMDDRVHPGHARKMVARMEEFKKPVLYYENTEGGHASGANIEQQVQRWAREYTYLSQRLMDSN